MDWMRYRKNMNNPDFITINGEEYVRIGRAFDVEKYLEVGSKSAERKVWDVDNPPSMKKTVLKDDTLPTPNPIPFGFPTKEVFNPDFTQWLKCFVLKTVTDPESVQNKETMEAKIELIKGGFMPTKAHACDAAWDCYARLVEYDNKYGVIRCYLGFKYELPEGWYIDIRPRSSIYKTGLLLSNSPGTCDSSYRGEVSVNFYPVTGLSVPRIGDRVCQMMIKRIEDVALVEGKVNMNTVRGENGFGSTGV